MGPHHTSCLRHEPPFLCYFRRATYDQIDMGKQKPKARKQPSRIYKLLRRLNTHLVIIRKKIPLWAWASVLGLTATITLLEGYPWLSVHENEFLDPSNAFSEMWLLQNDGYVRVTNLDAYCIPDAWAANQKADQVQGLTGVGFPFAKFADFLDHSGTVTIPCFHVIDLGGLYTVSGSRLTIEIDYSFLYIPFVRRFQRFNFESIVGPDGVQHWIHK
jgi:hypothetical protein